MKNIVSFSGGKDSTAMLLMMLEKGIKVDDIVWCDMEDFEFPQMKRHIKQVEEYIGRKITRVICKHNPLYMMIDRPVKNKKTGKFYRKGNNWASPSRRWCTREKIEAINRYVKQFDNVTMFIGFAFDELKRADKETLKKRKWVVSYPLINWEVTEKQALEYCKSKGFNWSGLYEVFDRVSCFCCPLQSLKELRNLRKYYPGLWAKMLDWDNRIDKKHGVGFRGYETVHDLEKRFACEDRQIELAI